MIGLGTNFKIGYARSSTVGAPTPELAKHWSCHNLNAWQKSEKFSISPVNPVYPDLYNVSYSEEAQDLSELPQAVLGNYEMQEERGLDDTPLYKNRESGDDLFLDDDGNWKIQNSYSNIYQESNGSPLPVSNKPWILAMTKNVIDTFSVNPIQR